MLNRKIFCKSGPWLTSSLVNALLYSLCIHKIERSSNSINCSVQHQFNCVQLPTSAVNGHCPHLLLHAVLRRRRCCWVPAAIDRCLASRALSSKPPFCSFPVLPYLFLPAAKRPFLSPARETGSAVSCPCGSRRQTLFMHFESKKSLLAVTVVQYFSPTTIVVSPSLWISLWVTLFVFWNMIRRVWPIWDDQINPSCSDGKENGIVLKI